MVCQKLKILFLEPSNTSANFNLGLLLAEKGKTAEAEDRAGALAVLNQQVRQQATNQDIYFLLGDLYEKSGQPSNAKKIYQQALADQKLPAAAKPGFAARLRDVGGPARKR